MGDGTGISWTDATWNPIRGCSRVSEGCRHCYAETVAARFCGPGQPYEGLADRTRPGSKWTGEVRFVAEHLADPLRWKKPRRIFVNSMSDLFHERLTIEQIAAVFGVMAAAPQHTFQVLTKRPKRMREWFAWVGAQTSHGNGTGDTHAEVCRGHAWDALGRESQHDVRTYDMRWPLPNLWLGVSVENQDAADERIPELLATPAAIRFLSCEPLLGPLSLKCHSCGRQFATHDDGGAPYCTRMWPDWIIAGCESGPGARACDVAWLRSLRDQCAAVRVPFFLKQGSIGFNNGIRGDLAMGEGSKRKGGSVIELPYLDGVQHAAFPEVSQ